MLRFVAVRRDEGLTLVLDERRTLPGRGAWVHPDLACFDLAVRRKAFGRALRVTAMLDVAEARGAMERALPEAAACEATVGLSVASAAPGCVGADVNGTAGKVRPR